MKVRPLFVLTNKVIKGASRGQKLGFPTANLEWNGNSKGEVGVYAVTVKIGNKKYCGVANVGIPLTFYDDKPRVDVHVLDYKGILYGKQITVEFWSKLRNIKRFDCEQELIWQIEEDVHNALNFFKTLEKTSEFFSLKDKMQNFATSIFNF